MSYGIIPGKSHEQKIIVDGHYEKYLYGFQDDCCTISLVATIAKAMIDSGHQTENDICFIAHGTEEWGVTDSQFDWTTIATTMKDGIIKHILTKKGETYEEENSDRITCSRIPLRIHSMRIRRRLRKHR